MEIRAALRLDDVDVVVVLIDSGLNPLLIGLAISHARERESFHHFIGQIAVLAIASQWPKNQVLIRSHSHGVGEVIVVLPEIGIVGRKVRVRRYIDFGANGVA